MLRWRRLLLSIVHCLGAHQYGTPPLPSTLVQVLARDVDSDYVKSAWDELSTGWRVVLVGVAVVGGLTWYHDYIDKKNESFHTPNNNFTPSYVYTPSPSDDLDCVDIGREVYVGYDDPYNLDADYDGWACEGW